MTGIYICTAIGFGFDLANLEGCKRMDKLAFYEGKFTVFIRDRRFGVMGTEHNRTQYISDIWSLFWNVCISHQVDTTLFPISLSLFHLKETTFEFQGHRLPNRFMDS